MNHTLISQMNRVIHHNNKFYQIEHHRLPIIGDLFILPSGKIQKAESLAQLEVLTDNNAELLIEMESQKLEENY